LGFLLYNNHDNKSSMKDYFRKPVVIAPVVLVVIIVASLFYFNRQEKMPADVVLAQKIDLVQEVSVVGQVKPVQTVDLSFKRGGRIDKIRTPIGSNVSSGSVLVELDALDKIRTVRDAELSLENARLELEKLLRPIEQEININDLKETYEDGLEVSNNVFSQIVEIIDDLENIFFSNELSGSENNIEYYISIIDNSDGRFKDTASELKSNHSKLEPLFELAFAEYQKAVAGGDSAQIEKAILSTYDLVKLTSEVIKNGFDVIRTFNNKSILGQWTLDSNKLVIVDAHISSLSDYQTTISQHFIELFSITNTIRERKNTIGTDDLTYRAEEIKVAQRENDLNRAKDELADSYLRAPFRGTITDVSVEMGEIISAGNPVVSLISSDNFEVEANVPEADIAKIKVGDSAILTLDAYGSDTFFEAVITSIDPGEITIEGVSTYRVTLRFKESDSRIRSGLTTDINILTDKREQVVAIPQRSIINKDGIQLVRLLNSDGNTTDVEVETGLRSSDGNIEIVSGIKEGDKVVIPL